MPLIIALALVSGLAILLIFIHLKLRQRLVWILPTLFMGAILAIAADELQQMGVRFAVIGGRDPVMTLFYALFAVGLFTQLMTFVYLRFVIYPSSHFKSPVYGMLYSIWAGIGLLLPELFTLHSETYAMLPVLNFFGHISLAAVLGYFISMAKISEDPQQNFMYLNSGLGAAIIIQGLHEFFIWEQQFPNLIVLILGTSFLSLMLTAHLLRQGSQDNSAEDNRKQHLKNLFPDEEE